MSAYRVCLCYLLVIGCTLADYRDYKQKWIEFKKVYNKQYENLAAEKQRFQLFISNHKKIDAHNKLYDLGDVTYKLKSNQFVDLSHKEFLKNYIGDSVAYKNAYKNRNVITDQLAKVKLPPFVDWRQNGTVTDVQNQGHCRSSYSFATTGVLEGQYQKTTGNLIKFSEQNLIDCTANKYSNAGCKGGNVAASLKFVSDNHGIDNEQSYPYQGKDRTCQLNGVQTNITIKSVNHIRPGQEWLLQTAIATVGPVSVEFDASRESFQFYSSGIYYDYECSKTKGNHFGLAVGYGTEHRLGYYIVKNSFGKSWGEEGYIRMSRFRANNCGIASNAIYPSLV